MMFYYGAQYFRPPTPARDDWRRDFEGMRAADFNVVKLWPMWRWNHPVPDVFFWDELVELMDLALEFDLRVILNPIFDTAPVWFFQKYPDCRMVTASGSILHPKATPCRQIGGADSVCFHQPHYKSHSESYFISLVNQFREHPALLAWDIWNEPWLAGGFDNSFEGSVCYCDWSARCFRDDLKNRYGSIEALNHAWARNYRSFGDVELPRCKGTLTDNLDFRSFMSRTLTLEMQRRAAIVRSLDTEHLVMSHSALCTVNTDPVSMGNDDWELAECLDVYGASAGGFGREEAFSASPRYEDLSFEMAGVRSAAGVKPIWVPESHALDGMASHQYGRRTEKPLWRWTAQMIAGGAKGIVYWQYRPERLGLESPGWGITEMDGSRGQHHGIVSRIGSILKEHGAEIAEAHKAPSQIAILYAPDNALFGWLINRAGYLKHSLRGIFRALYDANFDVDFVHARRGESFARYRLIYCPFPVLMDKPLADALRAFVHQGGTLVAEAQCGAFQREDGLRSLKTPGWGLDEVFGCLEQELFLGDYLPKENLIIRAEEGLSIQGDYAKEVLQPSRAEVLGTFSDGSTAMTSSRYGAGEAILVGSYLGAAVFYHAQTDLSEFLARVAQKAGCARTMQVRSNVPVRADVLHSSRSEFVILINHAKATADVRVELDKCSRTALDVFTGQTVKVSKSLECSIEPESARIFRLE